MPVLWMGNVMEHTDALKRVLANARRTARYMGDAHVGTEHVLIALAGTDDTMARRMLRRDQTARSMIARARAVLTDVPDVTGELAHDDMIESDVEPIDRADVGNDE